MPNLSRIIDPSNFSMAKIRLSVFEKTDCLAKTILGGMNTLKTGTLKIMQFAVFAKNASVNAISQIAAKIFSRDFLKYTAGPAVSLALAGCVRLSLGKRVPTSGPMYLSLGLASFVLCTVLGYQYFSHPKTQKKIQQKGLVATVHDALPIGHAKIKEPLLARSMLSHFTVEPLVKGIGQMASPSIMEADAKQMLIQLRRFSDWVTKKIKVASASRETLQVLKEEFLYMLATTLQSLVIFGNQDLVAEAIRFVESDEVVKKVIPEQERKSLLLQWGYRTCVLNKKNEFLPLFKELKLLSVDLQAFDAVIASHMDLVITLTNEEELDPQKMQTFVAPLKDPASKFGLETKKCNLIQVAIIKGDIEVLRRVVASVGEEVNWDLTDDQGLGYLQLAALSGSKPVWDFIKSQGLSLPKIDTKEYLELLYCCLKGNSHVIFEEIQLGLFDEDDLPMHKALIEDLFEKAILFGAEETKACMLKHIPNLVKGMEQERLKSLLIVSILSGNKVVFDQAFSEFGVKAKTPSEQLKAELLYSCIMAASFNKAILTSVLELSPKISSLNFASTQGYNEELFAKNLEMLDIDEQKAVLACFDKSTISAVLKKRGPLMAAFTRNVNLLAEACAGKIFNVQELYELAKETIRLGKHECLDVLIDQGIDVLRKLNLREESLIHLAAVSFNTRIMETVLRKCPPLSSATIAELKACMAELKCHSDDDEVVSAINRMLDVKSLGRGSQPLEDATLQLAINKARSMEFEGRVLSDPTETRARSLLGAGLSLFGY
jgi:hypothetical protein